LIETGRPLLRERAPYQEVAMTEKEKRIINKELWLQVCQTMEGSKHAMEILGRVSKIICKLDDNLDGITPQKRKVIEELCLLRDFLEAVNEDLKEIEAELGTTGIVPDMPEFDFRDKLWLDGGDALTTMLGKLDAFQSKQSECIFQLQDLVE
jgi:hypothetical protein